MLGVKRTLKSLFNPFSSSAPEVKHERESSFIDPVNEESPPPPPALLEDMDPVSPDNYEDAAEDLNHIELTPPPLVKQRDKSAKKEKKAKRAKRAEQIQQAKEPDLDDLDLSSHFEKIGSIAAEMAGRANASMGVDAEEGEPDEPALKPKKSRKNSGLSKRDRIMMEENIRNGYLAGDAEAMGAHAPEAAELPAKVKKAKKHKKKSLERAATPPAYEDEDDELILQQQLSPTKSSPPLESFSQDLPDQSMDGNLAQDEENAATAISANTQKKKKKKRTLSESQGEASTTSKKRSRVEDSSNGDIHAVLNSRSVVQALNTFARKSKSKLAEERSSPPPRPKSSNFDIVLPSSPPDSILPLTLKQKAARNAMSSERQPRPTKKSTPRVMDVIEDLTEIPSEQPEPPEGTSDEDSANSDEADVEPEPEPEPAADSISESDYEVPVGLDSSQRKKRRMPLDSNDEQAKPKRKSASKKSSGKTPQKATASQKSSNTAAKPGKMTNDDADRITRAVESYRDVNGLDKGALHELITSSATKKESKSYEFWTDIWAEIPYLPRRNIQAFVRRNFHGHRRDAWTEQDEYDLDLVYHQIKDKQTVNGGFWKAVGDVIDRYSEDCRDRWRTFSSCKNRNVGPWTLEEEDFLREAVQAVRQENLEAVRRLNREAPPGSKKLVEDSEPNWMEVAKKMEGTRTRLQCLNKWQLLCERESGEGEDRVALAPISQTPWRARPALKEAQAMTIHEKIHILALIMDSGAAQEGKIPWRSFPDSKGYTLGWRTFLRGMLRSIPADFVGTFQEKIAYLHKKHEAREALKFDPEAGEFKQFKLSRKSPTKKKTLTTKFVPESEDGSESEEEEEAKELPKPLRERMKKDGESQETIDSAAYNGDSDENMSDVFEAIRTSGKTTPTSRKSEERIMDSPESSVYDDNDMPESSYLVTKSRSTKRAPKARQIVDTIVEIKEEEGFEQEPEEEIEETEAEELDEDPVEDEPAEEDSEEEPEAQVEEAIQEEITSDSMQIDNEYLSESSSSHLEATAGETMEGNKSDEAALIDEPIEEIDVDMESVGEPVEVKNRNSKKAKNDLPIQEVEEVEEPEEPEEPENSQESEEPEEYNEPQEPDEPEAEIDEADQHDESMAEVLSNDYGNYDIGDPPLEPSETEILEKKEKKKRKKSKRAALLDDAEGLLAESTDQHVDSILEELADVSVPEEAPEPLLEHSENEIPKEKKKKSKKAKKAALAEESNGILDDSTNHDLNGTIEKTDNVQDSVLDYSEGKLPKEKKKKRSKKAKKSENLEDPVMDHGLEALEEPSQILPEVSLLEEDELPIKESADVEAPPSKKKKSKKSRKVSSIEEPLENLDANATIPDATEEHATAALTDDKKAKKKKSKKQKVAELEPSELHEDPIEDFVEPLSRDVETLAEPQPPKKKKSKKSKKRRDSAEGSGEKPVESLSDNVAAEHTPVVEEPARKKKSKKEKRADLFEASLFDPSGATAGVPNEADSNLGINSTSLPRAKKHRSFSIENMVEDSSQRPHEDVAGTLKQSKKKNKKAKDIPPVQENLPDMDAHSDAEPNELDEMLARKLNQKSRRAVKDDPYPEQVHSDESATLEAMLSKRRENKKARRAYEDSVASSEQEERADITNEAAAEQHSDSYADGAYSYQEEDDAEFDVKNDDIEIGSPYHQHVSDGHEPQGDSMSDRASVDLSQTTHTSLARNFGKGFEQEVDDHVAKVEHEDNLDNEPHTADHDWSDSPQEASPILQGTPQVVQETYVPVPRTATSEMPAKEKKRKHADTPSDQKPKKKRKVDVRRAQYEWEQSQPRATNGFTPINGAHAPNTVYPSDRIGTGSRDVNYNSDDSSGSDSSIPAVAPPKTKKLSKKTPKKKKKHPLGP
ncbi:DNA-binding protein REB1 [Phlyctema vagabunda]|uniref:DNA-binding protein REB1 n=1 Tax=Phlyctema vagabunda TaxID=108571 RepID=A0ABR4P8U5_9HELO